MYVDSFRVTSREISSISNSRQFLSLCRVFLTKIPLSREFRTINADYCIIVWFTFDVLKFISEELLIISASKDPEALNLDPSVAYICMYEPLKLHRSKMTSARSFHQVSRQVTEHLLVI